MHEHSRALRTATALAGLTILCSSVAVGCSSDGDSAGDDTTSTTGATTTIPTEATTSTKAPETTTTAPTPVETTSVAIQNYTYEPLAISVKVGDTVTWTNGDDFAHTTTSDDDVWDSGPLDPTTTFTYTFTEAGTFAYHCDIHNFMNGSVVVQ